ncbi:MAG: polyhydroxyalkanoate depolymerase [Pseudomonadota bacterium]
MLNYKQGINTIENSFLYTLVEMHKSNFAPIRSYMQAAQSWIQSPYHPISYFSVSRPVNAWFELIDRFTKEYPKPEFGIHKTMVGEKEYYIAQETIMQKDFCNLVHFRKFPHCSHLPKLLIVAPLSGHYATLLRGTVEDCLPYFDVYITEWVNAREVPISKGEFTLDDFIDYTIKFMKKLAPDLHVMAVCQPSVPVAAAVSIMSADNNNSKYIPNSMTLIGGPIDARESPTEVSSYASKNEIHWFENNVITRVPVNYPGYMREVYPGFLQLYGFMSMNMKRHMGEHLKLFDHLITGDEDSAEIHKKFYNEYLAVMDMPAEFYLQTIKEVFKDHSLPQGLMVSRDRPVKLEAITKPGLLVLEGELDDITGRSQTEAAIKLCTGIPQSRKAYHLMKGVGHYGLFNGSKFRNNIVPIIRDFVYSFDQ